MDRTSLIAFVAAVGLAAGPGAARADCHEPVELLAEQDAADEMDNDEAAVEAIGDVALAPGVEDQREDADDHEAEGGDTPHAADAVTGDAAGDDFRSDEDRDLAIEDSAILPSAEDHVESRAPTMDIDCEEYPEFCAGDPILTDSVGPELSEPADPGASEPEDATGAPVIAERDC